MKKITLADILPKTKLEDIIDFVDDDAGVRYWERELKHRLNMLERQIGRKFTDDEWNGIIDIVEECSAKNEKGNIVEYFPFNFAWQMYRGKGK